MYDSTGYVIAKVQGGGYLSNFLFSLISFFFRINKWLTYMVSRSYLTGVVAAERDLKKEK